MTDTADPVRRPGRPRDARAEAAIRDAVRAVLAESGFGGLTIDGVAARAGVGKATIYRRWRSKEDLVRDVLGELIEEDLTPDTGTLAGDLRAMIDSLIVEAKGVRGQMMPSLCSEAQTDPALGAILDSLTAEKRKAFDALFERAKRRGEIRSGVDAEVCLDMLLGPVIFRRLISNAPLDARFGERVVETLVWGCQPRE